jgi:hypothetical protein
MENIWTVIGTAITVLGGSTAFRFYEKRAIRKDKEDDFIKGDCRDRIAKLEALLVQSSTEKDDLRGMVLNLTREVSALAVKVEYLTKENQLLHKTKSK